MTVGYTRQSAADIVTGLIVEAAPLNAEFNAIESSMNETTGHKHDGTAGGGAFISLATSIDTATKLGLAYGGTNGTLTAAPSGSTIVMNTAGTALTYVKNNFAGSAAPTVTDDSSAGYSAGSLWSYAGTVYICTSATVNAAAWTSIVAGSVVTLNKVQNSGTDTTPGYLANKITATAPLSVATLNAGGNETTNISITSANNTVVFTGMVVSQLGNNVLGTTQITGLTATGNTTLATTSIAGLTTTGTVTHNTGGIVQTGGNNSLVTTTIAGLTATGNTTLATTQITGLTATGNTTLATTQITGLTATGNTTLSTTSIAGLTTTGTVTHNTGGIVQSGGNNILVTTQITGLTATLAGDITGAAKKVTNVELKQFACTVNAIGNLTGTKNVDLTTGNVHTGTVTAATTLTLSGATSAILSDFVMIITNGGAFGVNWFSGIKWPNGAAPTLQSSGTDVLAFFTTDGGTTVRGALIQANSS